MTGEPTAPAQSPRDGPGSSDSAWLEGQLRDLRRDTEQLDRELTGLRAALVEQQRGSSELQGALATVEGRTRRHEAGQEIARAVQQQLTTLGQQLEEESALRRDQRGAIEREQQRDRDLAGALTRALEELRGRLDSLDQRVAGEGQRQRRLVEDVADRDRAEERLGEQIAAIEGRIAALAEAWAKEREERVRFAAALPDLVSTLDEVDARTGTLRAEIRRAEEDVAEVRARRDREDELLELVEQQRATRLRLEERLTALEGRLEEALQSVAGGAQERLAISQHITGAEERMRALGEALEAQRGAVIDHFRRLVEAEEAHGRQQIEEIEKRIRRGRSLLVRLSEGSQQAQQEQPL